MLLAAFGPLRKFWPHLKPSLLYLAETEVHVYSFSVAANILLSFFPFLIVVTSLVRYGLGWPGVEQGIYVALNDYFPGETGRFLVRNLQSAVYTNGKALSYFSMLLLLFTANGVFMPLEVALNRVWGIAKNRSFLSNQVISQVLVFGVGLLWFATTAIASPLARLGWLAVLGYKAISFPVTFLIVFLTYWLLPNARVPKPLIFLAALAVAAAIELVKLLNLLIWPWLYAKLSHEYGPFVNSVTILTWSFVFSLLFLAGAEWSARKARELDAPALPHA
ncbi:MAG: hypothetical protein OHK0021_13910 [Bryobacter sp.]